MASWSPAEMSLLEQNINQPDWLAKLRSVTGRSESSLKVQRAKLRASLGMGDGRQARGSSDSMDRYNRNAVAGSAQLLDATLRVGRWA